MPQMFSPVQQNYSAGEQDPQLAERADAAIYYSGAERMRNAFPIPHGGFDRRPGLLYRDELLPVIETVDLSGATITAPNGGTTANLTDGDQGTLFITTTPMGTTDPYVVFHVDMGPNFTDVVRFADVSNISTGTERVVSSVVSFSAPSTITATGLLAGFTTTRKIQIKGSTDGLNDDVFTINTVAANTITTTEATLITQGTGPEVTLIERADFLNLTEFKVQGSTDDVVWVDIGVNLPSVTEEDDRWYFRRAPSVPTTYRYFRLVRIGTTDADDRIMEVGQFTLWKDTSALSNDRQIEFESQVGETFTLLLTAFNARIFRDGIRQTDVAIPYASAQLPAINWTQAGDTLVTFHVDVQTWQVRKLDSDTSWNSPPLILTSIPTRTFGDIQAAGVENEPVWSDTRGWPRCGAFFKGRFYTASTRDLPGTYWGSDVNDIFSFKPPAPQAVDNAFEFTIGGGTATIYDMQAADLLFFITNDGPFHQLTPQDEPPTFSNVSVQGIRGNKRAKGPGFRSFQLDNAVVYTGDSGQEVNEIVEPNFKDGFQVNNLAFLAPHLIKDPVDIVLRPSLSADRGDIILIANSDGSVATLHTLRSRDFSGWSGWHVAGGAGEIQGKVLTVGTQVGGADGRYFATVERTINGQTKRYYEEFQDNVFLDSSVVVTATSETLTATTAGQQVFTYSFTSPAAAADLSVRKNLGLMDITDQYTVDLGAKTITLTTAEAATIVVGDEIRVAIKIVTVAVPHLEAETVRVRVDGAVGKSQVVTAGVVTIEEFADAEVQIGLNYPDVKEVLVNELQTKINDPLTEEEARFEVFGVSDGQGQGDGLLVRDMPAAVAPDAGTTIRGVKKRVFGAVVTVSDTQGFYFGANDQPTEPQGFEEVGDFLLDRRPPYRSGAIRIFGLQGWTLDGQTEITQRDPIPLTVLSVVRKIALAT